jgi:predicted RNA-binding protein YlqC (UPF0109 family)
LFQHILEDLALDETRGWAWACLRNSQILEVYVMTQAVTVAAGDDSAKNMRDLVLEMARALVDIPDSVSVEVFKDGDGTVLRLRVAPSDIGKVIGKQGRTARSMRTILGAASMKLKHRFALDIVEESDAGNT